jgi:hypothetical protein
MKCAIATLLDLHVGEVVTVADRRRVHETQQPLSPMRHVAAEIVAVLCADVDCRVGRKTAYSKNVAKFCGGVRGEKNTMTNEWKTVGLGAYKPS